jgi:hypothetical protein
MTGSGQDKAEARVAHAGQEHIPLRGALWGQPLLSGPAGKGGSTMASGKSDELKGRVKEAAESRSELILG